MSGTSENLLKKVWKRPRKAIFRQRAHCNPLNDTSIPFPLTPDHVDWSLHFPSYFGCKDQGNLTSNTLRNPINYEEARGDYVNGTSGPQVEILDVGCGYGGLMILLSPMFPDSLILGMEIREKVAEFVSEKLRSLRSEKVPFKENNDKFECSNVSVVRTNAMKFLVNYFRKSQLKRVFICYPDPHFKKSTWKRRIISISMLSLYAYVLAPGGLLYTVTDVKDLHLWILSCCSSHPLFEKVPEEVTEKDACMDLITNQTDEARKAIHAGKPRYSCVFRRVFDPAY